MIIYQCLKNEMGVKPRKPNKEGFKVYEKDIKEVCCCRFNTYISSRTCCLWY